MKASETKLRELLEGGKQFQIPLFQRPYSWSKKEWKALWEDIMEIYHDNEDNHFLGPIVTQAVPGTPDGISPFLLIDGQQRLTTLSLLLAALREHLKEQDSESAAELQELYLINRYKKGDAHYKILPTQADQEVYQKVVEGQINGSTSLIYETFKFFGNQLKNGDIEEDNSPIDLAKFKNVVLEKLTLVSITLDDRDNPYIIFESLNHRGAPLTQADLVRNYFFMRLTNKEQRVEVYDDIWFPLQQQFKDNAGEDKYLKELTRAFWCYLRKEGVAVNQNNIYQTLKSRLDKKSTDEVLADLKEFSQFSTYYIRICFPNKEPHSNLRRLFERLKGLDFSNCHPFLLNLYRDYAENKLSLNQFEQALRYVESFFVRRLFAGLTTRWMDKIFNNLYQDVKKRLKEYNSSDFISALREQLSTWPSTSKAQVWPDDNWFRQSIIENPVTGSRVKLFLESLEKPLTKFQVKADNLTLEHIMPQTLTKEWKALLGTNAEEVHKRWLHTLGNLTLTPYNSEMSNNPFSDKLSYLRTSALTLDNQYFKNVETWNAEEIQRRGEYLADIALKVWPR
ncbi:DUF262 domain-containing protein [Microcoleus sp. FACHB-53]|nr:DUF262 domain-containing protein [Microcoleus sp. FACHB-53]